MAWSHQGIGSPAHQLGHRSCPPSWLLLAGPADLRRPLWCCWRWTSLKLPDCQTTSCIHYYHHHQPHHNVMTLDSASTHSSCLNTLHTYRTVSFSCACYIKTNTRPTQFQLYTSLRHIALLITIFVYFRVLFIVFYVWPAFCHAIIKRILMMMMAPINGLMRVLALASCDCLHCKRRFCCELSQRTITNWWRHGGQLRKVLKEVWTNVETTRYSRE